MNLGGPERIQDVGPFLFNLYIQELSAVINEDCNHKESELISKDLFEIVSKSLDTLP